MSDDNFLRAKARELVRSGRLPGRRPERLWGGSGFAGVQCILCGNPVKHGEVAFELEFAPDDGAGATNPHLHVVCFLALEPEFENTEAADPEALPADRTQATAASQPAPR